MDGSWKTNCEDFYEGTCLARWQAAANAEFWLKFCGGATAE